VPRFDFLPACCVHSGSALNGTGNFAFRLVVERYVQSLVPRFDFLPASCVHSGSALNVTGDSGLSAPG